MSTPVGMVWLEHYPSLTMRPLQLLVLLLPTIPGCLVGKASPGEAPLPWPGVLEPAALQPEHRALAQLVGEWRVEIASPTAPSGMLRPGGSGTAQLSSIHGGRFLRLELGLDFGAGPVQLTGHVGFDHEIGLWQALWFSDQVTGMSLLEGTGGLDTGIHFLGERGGVRGRSVLELHGPDMFTLETYVPTPGGGDRLFRRSSYLRR